MGRTSDEEGETSAKSCRSDDSNDRPLKKARYVWQIKGKYHLKKPDEEGAKLYIADETRDGYTLHPIEVAHHESRTQRHEGGNTIVSENSEVPKPDSAHAPVVSDFQSPMESEDLNPRQLQKWQARQVARCFVDNTINRVLEDMGFIPLPVDADDLMEDFAMSGLRRSDEHLEDAAVMMAIHSHGLQRAVADMRGGNQNLNSVADTCVCNVSLDAVGLQTGFSDNPMDHMKRWYVPEFHNRSSPQHVQSPDVKHNLNNGFVREGCSVRADWNQPNVSLKGISRKELCDGQKEESGEMNKSSTTCNNFARELDSEPVDVEIIKNSEEPKFTSDMNLDDAEEESSASFEHTDFLDKAVSVAIQKKGLSTLNGVEYG